MGISNHPLLFGTVSPTGVLPVAARLGSNRNHPLLFGTVSPTGEVPILIWKRLTVTTPYCSGLSLLQIQSLALCPVTLV